MTQKQRYGATGRPEDRPDHELLCSGLPEWPIGLRTRPKLRYIGDRTYVEIELDKPKGEGRSPRLIDPEMFFVLQMHCVAGGRIALEAHGPDGDYHYLRLYLPGRRLDDARRRTYILRLAADTPSDRRTREGADHHLVRREDVRGFIAGTEGQVLQLKGVAEARADTLAQIHDLEMRKRSGLPPNLNAQLAVEMLDAGYAVLRGIPLGRDSSV